MFKKPFVGILSHPGYNGDFADDVLGFDPNGGGIYDIPVVGDIADAVVNSFVGNVIAFAFPPAAPFIYAAKTAQSLASGNELGALLNAVGAYTAYSSPTATTTGNLAGMEISGVNANLVKGIEMAQAGGASVTDIAKTLVGMGDNKAAMDIAAKAGLDTQEMADALNTAGKEAAAYVPSAEDGAILTRALQESGADSSFITEQLGNLGINANDAAYLQQGIASGLTDTQVTSALQGGMSLSDVPTASETFPLQPQYDIQGTPTATGTFSAGNEDYIPSEYLNGATDTPFGDQSALDYLNTPDPFADQSILDNLNTPVEYDVGQAANPYMPSDTRADMLAKQYEGFSQADIVEHMAGSSIDPVLAEEVLGNLGMDQFAISDWMDKNPTSFGNTYADPTFLDRVKKGVKDVKTLKSLWDGGSGSGGSGGTGGSGGGSGNRNAIYSDIMSQIDPYWGYRKNTEIPLMGAAAGAAGTLSGLYQQSFTDPLQAYNTPEMQAINADFMGDIQRRDAAAGRMSQYGARGVEAQNQYLTKALPAYRQSLQSGLGTFYNAAKPEKVNQEATSAAFMNATRAGLLGTPQDTGVRGALSNLQGSWNQMTNGGNTWDQIGGAVDTASNLVNLYEKGSKAWDTGSNIVSSWF